ncbi:MAG TPA: poly(R)-hydroxyalkanoic acid synthase subunit PhaE [Steroidobacteraceae bacterium]|nr:poly(R)-hydroxyalkanoic acid synthase subunit PhaE [Steroidobacteraceae bacterium]
MTDQAPFDPSQIADWLNQQRERLRGERAETHQDSESWIASMREWLKLLRPHANPMFGGQSQDELNQALRGLGTAQQSILDLLSKLPPLGIAASQFEPWMRLQTADAEFRKVEEQFRNAIVNVHLQALDELERRLKAREGAPLTERELYDLWVECGETVFTKVAHSSEFAQLQGAVSNAAVRRLREQQKVIEQVARMFDMPTRAELNSVHQQLRALRHEIETLKSAEIGGTPARAKSKRVSASATRAGKKPTRKSSKVSR